MTDYDVGSLIGSVIPAFVFIWVFFWVVQKITRKALASFVVAIPLSFIATVVLSKYGHDTDFMSQIPRCLFGIVVATLISLISIWPKIKAQR